MIVDIYSSSLHVWFSDSLSIPKKSASDSEWSGLRRGTDLVLKFWGLNVRVWRGPHRDIQSTLDNLKTRFNI